MARRDRRIVPMKSCDDMCHVVRVDRAGLARQQRFRLPVLAFLVITGLLLRTTHAADAPTGDQMRWGTLETIEGGKLEIGPGQSTVVVCFLGTECPLAKLYSKRLNQLFQTFASDRVRFVAVYSNVQDSLAEIESSVADGGIEFPVVHDVGNVWADRFDARRTPEIFVVDGDGRLRYHGRVDDQYLPGQARSAPQRDDLRVAVEQVVSGDAVEVPDTPVAGCLIGREKSQGVAAADSEPDVTFCNQIVRLLNQHCVECHRAGEIGPFALTDFEEVQGWAEMILEVVEERRMPPWHAAAGIGHFQNARGLEEGEISQLRTWVESGAPYGDAANLPDTAPEFVDGWELPSEPDQVIAMRSRAFRVPATGTVDYQYFVVDPGWEEDRWIQAAQVVPGHRSVVHHAIVFVRPPDGAAMRGVGWLSAYVPGQRNFVLPEGHARFVPAGSKLVFQMHYTPNGESADDLTKLGVVLADPQSVTHEVLTIIGIDQEFEIPPMAQDFPVNGTVRWFPSRGRLLTIVPHMHVRGRAFEVSTVRDDVTTQQLSVPSYDFNWQHAYRLKEPLDLDDIDAIDFVARFDNSANNPVNPDPTQLVTWGDQTWEEMAVVFFDVATPLDTGTGSESIDADADEVPLTESDVSAKIEDETDAFMRRLDTNGDGEIQRTETPRSFRRFGFWRFDRDGDRRLTREEVLEFVRSRH